MMDMGPVLTQTGRMGGAEGSGRTRSVKLFLPSKSRTIQNSEQIRKGVGFPVFVLALANLTCSPVLKRGANSRLYDLR